MNIEQQLDSNTTPQKQNLGLDKYILNIALYLDIYVAPLTA